MHTSTKAAAQPLAIVHLETSAGAIRVTVLEEEDGTLIAERIGSRLPHVFPVRVAELDRRGPIDDDASELMKEAIAEIETFAEITGGRQVHVK